MKYLLLKHYRGGPTPVIDCRRWTGGRRRRSTLTSSSCATSPPRLEGTGEYVDGQALAPDGAFVRSDGEGKPAGHRRPVRRDEGSHRRLDDHRRRVVGPRGRARRRAVGRARPGRRADPRVARGAAVPRPTPPTTAARMNDAAAAGARPRGDRRPRPARSGFRVGRGRRAGGAGRARSPTWPDDPPRDPKGWLVTVAWHKFLDDARSESARRAREAGGATPNRAPGPVPDADDTLRSTSCARTRRSRRRRRSR